MKRTKLNSFSAPVLNRKYAIAGEVTTLREYLNTHFYTRPPGGEKLTVNQVKGIVDLEPGQVIEMVDFSIKRLT